MKAKYCLFSLWLMLFQLHGQSQVRWGLEGGIGTFHSPYVRAVFEMHQFSTPWQTEHFSLPAPVRYFNLLYFKPVNAWVDFGFALGYHHWQLSATHADLTSQLQQHQLPFEPFLRFRPLSFYNIDSTESRWEPFVQLGLSARGSQSRYTLNGALTEVFDQPYKPLGYALGATAAIGIYFRFGRKFYLEPLATCTYLPIHVMQDLPVAVLGNTLPDLNDRGSAFTFGLGMRVYFRFNKRLNNEQSGPQEFPLEPTDKKAVP